MSVTDDTVARHNARVLGFAQALGGANPAIVISIGGLVGQMLAEDKQYATLPVSLINLGLALGTVPAAILMRRVGRRSAYLVGACIGILAGTVAAVGIASAAFVVFCLGTFIAGFYGSFVQSYRFAATDNASAAFKTQAISWVMIGGLASGIIGPQTVIWTRDAIPGVAFAGGFMGQAALALLSIPILALLRPAPVSAAPKAGGRPLGEILRQPRFVTAVVAGLVSYGLMSFLMTAAPLAMVDCGLPVGMAALGIQWHILAMFAPSFVTGTLIARFGKRRITAFGLVLIAAAAAVGLSGISLGHFWLSLVLLGIGWNFGFIGATSLVTECHRPEEAPKVQAANDFLVFGSVALASFSSGKLLDAGGWETLAWLALPPVAIALALLAWQGRTPRTAVSA
jgi:MFS family permease